MFRVYSCCISYCSHFLNPTCLFLKLSQIHMFDVLKHHRCCFIHSGNQTQHFFQSSLYFDFFVHLKAINLHAWCISLYPLVNCPIAIENHHCSWENPRTKCGMFLYFYYIFPRKTSRFVWGFPVEPRDCWQRVQEIRKLPPELLDVSTSEVKWCGDFNHVWWLNMVKSPISHRFHRDFKLPGRTSTNRPDMSGLTYAPQMAHLVIQHHGFFTVKKHECWHIYPLVI